MSLTRLVVAVSLGSLVITGTLLPTPVYAQLTQPAAPQELAAPIKLTAQGLDPASLKDLQFADPQQVKFTTKDNVEISATFYAGVHGKNTPVLLLLHDILGKGEELSELAVFLQHKYGFAVLVPDLRGHGASPPATDQKVDPEKMNRAQFDSFGYDIEACKKYLITHNDEGSLNIDMLTLVAVGKSCITATNWCLGDWSFPPLGGQRQGQDVKALVLISPEQSFKGSRITTAIRAGLFTGKDFPKPIHILLAVGRDSEERLDDAEAIRSVVARHRTVTDDAVEGLFVFDDYATNGAALTKAESGDLQSMIATFVYLELFQKSSEFPWQVRTKK